MGPSAADSEVGLLAVIVYEGSDLVSGLIHLMDSWEAGPGWRKHSLEGFIFSPACLSLSASWLLGHQPLSSAAPLCHDASALEPADQKLNPLHPRAKMNLPYPELFLSDILVTVTQSLLI